MPEYERSLMIDAPPEAIFAFVSDVNNLAPFLPAPHRGHPQDPDRRVRADQTEWRLHWDGGYVEIEEQPGAAARCAVTVHLSLAPGSEQAGTDEDDETITHGLETALLSIQSHVVADAPHLEPPAAS